MCQVIEFDDGSGSVLRIQPLRTHRDEAIYECTATNSVGEINTSAKLTVLEGKNTLSLSLFCSLSNSIVLSYHFMKIYSCSYFIACILWLEMVQKWNQRKIDYQLSILVPLTLTLFLSKCCAHIIIILRTWQTGTELKLDSAGGLSN